MRHTGAFSFVPSNTFIMERSLLETSEEFSRYLNENYSAIIRRIRAEDEDVFEDSKEWGFSGTPLYLLYSETKEELQNPTSLFYHISSILNKREGLVAEGDQVLSKDDTELLKEDLIVLHLDLLERMGTDSKFGDVMDANMDIDYMRTVLKDKFVVKIPKDSSSIRQRSVRNEFIIGYYGVNFIRRLVPNFIYTYGYFECGRPTEDDFCSVDGVKTGYMVIEKVPNVESTVEFLERATGKQISIFLLQAALAFAIAEEKISFTHNDAHLGNVLVRRLPRKEVIVYEYKGVTYRVLTDFIVVIIDYGYARCRVKYRKKGKPGDAIYRTESFLNDKTYFQNQPCAISDFFRILVSTLIHQGSGSGPKVTRIYEVLSGMNYKEVDMNRWARIYYTVYPTPRSNFADIIAYLYEEEPKEVLEAAPVYVNHTHDTPRRLNALIESGKIEITNVLQYFEYVLGFARDPVTGLPIPTYPNLTDEQRAHIADRTMNYLYQLYHKREKKKVMRLIRSYVRLFGFFLVKETNNLQEHNILYRYEQKFTSYMEMFPEFIEE